MTKKFLALSLLATCFLFSNQSFADNKIDNFPEAKRELTKIYHKLNDKKLNPTTIYCGYDVITKNDARKKLFVEPLENGYKIRKDKVRATRIEFEHVMPAHNFGHQLKCWQDGGRKNCEKTNPQFKLMESDLHNLYPAVGEINNDRGNFRFIDGNDDNFIYGSCKIIIDFKRKQVQPPAEAKGMIARSYLYMADRYNIKLNDRERKMFTIWNKEHLPTKYECVRNELIEKVQGNSNKYIEEKCNL